MSNLIFCQIDTKLCEAIKEIAGDKPIVDCGAGRGMFEDEFKKLYDNKVFSVDLEEPIEPLAKIINTKVEHFCFPINALPVFIRPCHGHFITHAISHFIYKCSGFVYVGLDKNIEIDLESNADLFTYELYNNWQGVEGERIWLCKFKKQYINEYKHLKGKFIYLHDFMLSSVVEDGWDEFKDVVDTPLMNQNILIDGLKLKVTDNPNTIFESKFDVMFFDWGGASMGNSLLENFCRYIIREAEDNPSKTFVMVSQFTEYAMRDAINEFGDKLNNVYFNIKDFTKTL